MMKILIAEDDITSRLVLDHTLKKAGYEVLVAADGREAMEALETKGAPRLVVLDWMMPEMDGAEVCGRVREKGGSDQPYIIMLTALESKQDLIRGLSSGADDYIAKPFDREELLARIRVGERIIELQDALSTRVTELEDALSLIKKLQGVIPICMYCHKIRSDEEAWNKLEKYIEENSEAQFSHSICPECLEEHFPEDEERPASNK